MLDSNAPGVTTELVRLERVFNPILMNVNTTFQEGDEQSLEDANDFHGRCKEGPQMAERDSSRSKTSLTSASKPLYVYLVCHF